VGEKNYGSGDRACAGWARKLREAGIAVAVIEQVKAHFAQQLARRRQELQDQLDEATDEEERVEVQAELEATSVAVADE
jgi:crotonobetainyl-CoA:carnitine CoA-transferase CaiB-like acyl-CoA transferase